MENIFSLPLRRIKRWSLNLGISNFKENLLPSYPSHFTVYVYIESSDVEVSSVEISNIDTGNDLSLSLRLLRHLIISASRSYSFSKFIVFIWCHSVFIVSIGIDVSLNSLGLFDSLIIWDTDLPSICFCINVSLFWFILETLAELRLIPSSASSSRLDKILLTSLSWSNLFKASSSVLANLDASLIFFTNKALSASFMVLASAAFPVRLWIIIPLLVSILAIIFAAIASELLSSSSVSSIVSLNSKTLINFWNLI